MTTTEQFDALKSSEQWPFVFGLDVDRSKIKIMLSSDATRVCFMDDPMEDWMDHDDDRHTCHFDDCIGNSSGVLSMLTSLGFSAWIRP